jgi:hypothetical protein
MTTMFIVLTGENWNYVMELVIENNPDVARFAIGFFVSAMVTCHFMLLNLFLAILLKYLQDAVISQKAKEKLEAQKKKEEKISEQH